MVRHRVSPSPAAVLALAWVLAPPPAGAGGEAPPAPSAALELALAEADASLRSGEPEIAESRYRTALLEGWLLQGALELAAGDLPAARDALLRASTAAIETRRALTGLAIVQVQLGEPAEAVAALRRLPARYHQELATRRLLAQALVAAGQPEQAVQELEEARGGHPDDPELAFTLASGYLRLGRIDDAAPLFDEVAAARPVALTHVLVGRTYRDFGLPDRARAALARALEMDPRARRAHYYLGTLALLDPDGPRLEAAISELRQELALFPDDQASKLYLGMALVEAQRHDEALPVLTEVARGERADAEALYYLGRCQLALQRPREAAETLRRALALAPVEGVDARRVQGIEYQLALALRRDGREAEAAAHFAAAERLSSQLAERSQDRLARYLSEAAEPIEIPPAALAAFTATTLDALGPAERDALRRRVASGLARAHLNLAVMRLQAGEFDRAVELLDPAAGLDPALPGLQRALGVARFNARRYAAAIEPLSRALEGEPGDAELRRLLALARLETGAFAEAATLLAGDEQRATNPPLQYAYALALVRSGKPDAARTVFDELLRTHADWPELHVLLGQAHASEDDFDAAVASLRRALELSPTVPEAQLTLGTIFLRQGRLDDAAAALRAELVHHPEDRQARYQLATVLELAGEQEEAISQVRRVLAAAPELADGRYLLGKMLLARGDPAAAAAELEAAAALAPGDYNIRYQLGQAYQKLGRVEQARQAFDAYRELKAASSGGAG
jgi:tetratricopeptide (TPR) repeat protein